jgi:hypothetical protein
VVFKEGEYFNHILLKASDKWFSLIARLRKIFSLPQN